MSNLCRRGFLTIVFLSIVVMATLKLGAAAEGGAVALPSTPKHEVVSVQLPGAAFSAMQTIDPEHIRWHVRYLASDLLEGRGTGQRGGDIAAEYIATQFAEYGLKAVGDAGS